jgi:hypothetical protein
MPVSYRIDTGRRTIFGALEGSVSDQDLIDAARMLYDDDDYCPEYSRLIDATKANMASVTGEGMRLVASCTAGARVGRTALVAHTDAVYGMLRIYQAYAGRAECQVFRQLPEALAWLAGHKPTPASLPAAA